MSDGPIRTLQSRGATSRHWLAGFLSAPVLACAVTAATVRFWPPLPMLATFVHMLDSLALHLAVFAGLGAVVLAMMRAPRGVVLMSATAVAASLASALWHQRSVSQPFTTAEASVQVLWFNMLWDNPTSSDTLAKALIDSPADVIIVAESEPLRAVLPDLQAAFPVQRGCPPVEQCNLVVLSRRADGRVAFRRIGRTRETRLAVIELPGPDGLLTIVAVHLTKPWFFGITEEEAQAATRAIANSTGALVVVGDFNAAPWSLRMRHFTGPCALNAPRLPPPTWPNGLGWAGLAIDHVLVRDASLTRVDPWGRDLGSNHVGLLAGVSLETEAPGRSVDPACSDGS